MSLEHFNTDKEDVSSDDGGFKIEQGNSESPEHYRTKCVIALQLEQLGYTVSTEKEFKDSEVVCDIYATIKDGEGGINSDSLPHIDFGNIVVEIGDFTPKRATQTLSVSDCIIWVPKGENISKGTIILEGDIVQSATRQSDTDDGTGDITTIDGNMGGYVNIEGESFVPRMDELYIDKYQMIGEEIVKNYRDGREMDVKAIASSISLSHHTVTVDDVTEVLKALAYY